MAASMYNTRGRKVDYLALNNGKELPVDRKKSDKVYFEKAEEDLWQVERVISRRKVGQKYQYLIQWRDWPLTAVSWQPEENLTPDLIANFQSPNVSKERVQAAAANLFAVFQKRLRGTGAVVPIEVECPLDVFRSCFGEKGTPACIRGYRSYQREDFTSLELPRGWEYFVKQDGNGQCLAFPVLMKEVLTFTQPNYELSEDGTIVKIEEVLPIERVLVRACLNGYQLS